MSRLYAIERRIWAACALALLFCAGCAPRRATVLSDSRRSGRVYLIRGLLNIYSLGMDSLARKLREDRVDARVSPWMSHVDLSRHLIKTYREGNREPICLIGHSQGVDHALSVARALQKENMNVHLMVSIEEWISHEIPSNVDRVVTIHKRESSLHFEAMDGARGREVEWRDVDLSKNAYDRTPGYTYHFFIDIDPRVHRIVLDEVLRVCSDVRPHVDGRPKHARAVDSPL
jgi:hypothetical protein